MLNEGWRRERESERKSGPVGSSVTQQTGRVVEVVNNKLIRNGSKIAMDERPDEQDPWEEGGKKRKKRKSQSWSSELWAPSIMWGLTSYQQSEQEQHLINQSWQLLLGPISSTAFPLPLPQFPLSFTFCKFELHRCPPSRALQGLDLLIPLVVSKNIHSILHKPEALTDRGQQVMSKKVT